MGKPGKNWLGSFSLMDLDGESMICSFDIAACLFCKRPWAMLFCTLQCCSGSSIEEERWMPVCDTYRRWKLSSPDCIDSPWMATLAVIIEPLVIMWSFLKWPYVFRCPIRTPLFGFTSSFPPRGVYSLRGF